MGFGAQMSFANIPAVHAKPDVVHVSPDGQGKREHKDPQPRQDRESKDETPHPVPNTQGQITGKLIDITA